MSEVIGNPHGLNESVLYGPVPSRRYGLTLGINFFRNGAKSCTFHCVYCQLGPENTKISEGAFPVSQILSELNLASVLKNDSSTDAIVLSGNGEPTAHPHFADLFESIVSMRDSWQNRIPVVVLTNGFGFRFPDVCNALMTADEVALKLDPHPQRANAPEDPEHFKYIFDRAAQMSQVTLQCCVYDGKISNAHIDEAWLKAVGQIHPKRIDLYTVSRATAIPGVVPVSEHKMNELAQALKAIYSGKIRVFS